MLLDVRGQQENVWVLLFYTEGRGSEKGASNQTSRPSRHPAVTRDSLRTQLPIGQEEAWKYLGGPTETFKETRETQNEVWGEVVWRTVTGGSLLWLWRYSTKPDGSGDFEKLKRQGNSLGKSLLQEHGLLTCGFEPRWLLFMAHYGKVLVVSRPLNVWPFHS